MQERGARQFLPYWSGLLDNPEKIPRLTGSEQILHLVGKPRGAVVSSLQIAQPE